jgi:hypothetical protein
MRRNMLTNRHGCQVARTGIALLFVVAASKDALAVGLPKLTEEQLQKVAAISHDGIGFSTSLSEFLERCPEAKPTRAIAGGANGVSAYELTDNEAADHVIFAFLGQELIEIGYIFEAERVAENGDGFILLDRAIARFGRPTTIADASAHWDFPTIDRTVRSKATANEWWLRICRRSSWENLPQAKSLAPTAIVNSQPIKPRGTVPEEALAAIRKNARFEHPGEPEDQAHYVETQIAAYREVERYIPDGIPAGIIAHLKQQAKRKHRNNFQLQLIELKRQTKGYWGLQEYERPDSIAQGTMYRLYEAVARDHPYDFATQLYALDRRTNEITNR